MDRRLTAILAADMVGYSRLIEQNEAATHERLKAVIQDIFSPKIAAHNGRVVKTNGDGLLVEFPSFVEAVLCGAATDRDHGDCSIVMAAEAGSCLISQIASDLESSRMPITFGSS